MEDDSEKTWVLILAPPLNSSVTQVEIFALMTMCLWANHRPLSALIYLFTLNAGEVAHLTGTCGI